MSFLCKNIHTHKTHTTVLIFYGHRKSKILKLITSKTAWKKVYRKTLRPWFLLAWPSSWETPNRCSHLVLSEWLRYGLWSQSTRVDFSAFLSRPLVMSKELDLCVPVLLFYKIFWIISAPQNSNTGDGTEGRWWAFGVWAAMPWCFCREKPSSPFLCLESMYL